MIEGPQHLMKNETKRIQLPSQVFCTDITKQTIEYVH